MTTEVVTPHLPLHEFHDSTRTLTGGILANASDVVAPKRFVYVLKTESQPSRYYTGVTSDVHGRLRAHNERRSPHTADRGPWQLDVIIEFADEHRSVRFEQYLKSGSGCAFAKRHLR